MMPFLLSPYHRLSLSTDNMELVKQPAFRAKAKVVEMKTIDIKSKSPTPPPSKKKTTMKRSISMKSNGKMKPTMKKRITSEASTVVEFEHPLT